MAATGRATRFAFRAFAIIFVTMGLSAPGGCAATSTKATLESNLHSSDLMFRSQSCDITARMEWTL